MSPFCYDNYLFKIKYNFILTKNLYLQNHKNDYNYLIKYKMIGERK